MSGARSRSGVMVITRSRTLYHIDPAGLPDGALPVDFSGGVYTVSGGKIINVPVGVEKITNGGFEDPYNTVGTLSIANGWTNLGMVDGVDTAAKEVVITHGGAASQKLIVSAQDKGVLGAIVAITNAKYYGVSVWVRGGVNVSLDFNAARLDGFYFSAPAGGFVQAMIGRKGKSNGNDNLSLYTTDSAGTIYLDDASFLELSIPSMITSVDVAKTHCITKAEVTLASPTTIQAICGVVSNLDSAVAPLNFVSCWIDNGTKLYMQKTVGGVVTTLINGVGIVYDPEALPEIRRLPGSNTFQAFYRGVQVSIDRTIADAGIINNTRYGLIHLGGGNQIGAFTVIESV